MTELSCARATERIAAARFDDLDLLRHAADCPSCALELARQRFARLALDGHVLVPTVPPRLKEQLRALADEASTAAAPSSATEGSEGRAAIPSAHGRRAERAAIEGAVRAIRRAVKTRIEGSKRADEEGTSRETQYRRQASRMEEGEAALRMLRRALQRHGDAFIAESTRQGMLAAEAEREYERALVMAAWDYGPGGRSSFLADGVALLAETRRLLTLFTELRHFARELWRDKGRQATPDELAQGIGHTVAFVSRLLRWRRRHEQMELQQESDEERRSKLDLAKLLGNPGSPRRHDPHRHDREALEHERQIALAILAGRQGLNALSTGSVRELGTEASRRPLERAILVSKGHSAHVRLVAAYTPLVSHMARGFAAPGLSLTGLIAQGTAGLIEAVDNPSELGTTRFAERAARAIHRALSAEAATQRRLSQIPMPLSAVGGSARATLSEQVRRGPGSWEDEGGAIWRASAKERADWLARVRESAGFLDRSVDELERSRGRAPAPYIEAGRLDMAMLLRSPDVTTCEALLWLSVDEARAAILAWGLDAGAPLDAREIDRRLGGSLAGKREIKGGAGKMIRQAGVQL